MGEGIILRGEMKGVLIEHSPNRVENSSRGVDGFPGLFYILVIDKEFCNIVLNTVQQ